MVLFHLIPARKRDEYFAKYIEKSPKRESVSLEVLERVAKAIWNWEHENRQSEILDVEWSLLRSDYLCRAQIAIAAYNGIEGGK